MPSTQAIAIAIATDGYVCIAQELGAMRRIQEDVVDDKKTTPKKRGGVEQVTKLFRLTRVSSKSDLPPIYMALVVGKGGSPRLCHPTECIYGSLFGNYYCCKGDTHLCPRHRVSSLCWREYFVLRPRGVDPQCCRWGCGKAC